MARTAKSAQPTLPRNRRLLTCCAVAGLLSWYYISSQTAAATKCTTSDEVFHLTGGYSYWKFGDFRTQPENGNLPQRWAALPLLFSDTRFPDRHQETWLQSDMILIGDQFFYDVGN